ncbi:MAG: alginate lyase family protein [Flavobacteriales bacterium]|nr:alginate lyase family protein [Flavobacteriales bacterium]
MALAANNLSNKDEIILEFKNQSLDFIVSNPIGMGVQWACAMDVGIRVSNWLVAYDLFKQLDNGNLLDDVFTLIFTDSIHRHAEFIMNHLERKEGAAGNHYLFNLVGILFITSYLSEKEETLTWRRFAENEIQKEFFKQFFIDGGNFEGSTTYHCLSAEAMLYATALMLRNDKKLSEEYVELLSQSYQFIQNVIKPNGEMPQFGDNDSGRLFVFDKNLLNYESLLTGFGGLFGNKEGTFLEQTIISQISKNKKIKNSLKGIEKKFQLRDAKHQVQKPKTTTIKFDSNIDVKKIKTFSYAEFGIYVFKSSDFYLAISAISNKKMHHSWGHVHNDKLSFDLQVNRKDLVKDPGTYYYSSFPEKRNEFRSVKAHNGIIVKEVEQNKAIGLFYLDREVKCKVLEVQDLSMTLQVNYYGVEHVRKFTIQSNQLIITDYCNKSFKVNINKFDKYSPNYGVCEKLN